MPTAFSGTDALLPDGRPNLYSVAGNQIHGERVAKEIRQDAEWWAKHRHLSDAKFAHAVGAIPDKVKIKYPEIPGPKLGKEAADAVTEEDLLRMDTGYISTMQSDFFWAQSSGVWDWYKESGAMTRKTHNKKGLPKFYGATLHATSVDGTDFSSRAH